MFLKRGISILGISFLLCSCSTTVTLAQGTAKKAQNNAIETTKTVKRVHPSIVSDRKINLYEGSLKILKQGKEIVRVYFQGIDRQKQVAHIVIQDILFEIKDPKTPLDFKWKDASFSLRWLLPDSQENTDRIQMTSDKPFVDIKYNTTTIRKDLFVKAHVQNNVVSSLKVTDLKKDSQGRVQTFSLKMTPDVTKQNVTVEDHNIAVPKVKEQYERAINGKVIYLFAQDLKGQVHLYYR